MSAGVRVLVTGSRDLQRLSVVRAAFEQYLAEIRLGEYAGTPPEGHYAAQLRKVVVVEGGARGADKLARVVAAQWGMTSETYEAQWDGPCAPADKLDPLTGAPWCPPRHRRTRGGGGTYCPRAGHRRNQHMVNLGADRVLAFPLGRSPGTRDCIARARAAGLDVRVYEGNQS